MVLFINKLVNNINKKDQKGFMSPENQLIVFEDTDEKNKKKTETLLLIFGIVLIAGSTLFIFWRWSSSLTVILTLIAVSVFILIFLKKGSGINYKANIKVTDKGIYSNNSKKLISWKEITRVEIVEGTIGRFSGTAPIIGIIQGNNVISIP